MQLPEARVDGHGYIFYLLDWWWPCAREDLAVCSIEAASEIRPS